MHFHIFCCNFGDDEQVVIVMEEVYYPIGEQNFEKIITGGWFYVDKTGYIRRFLKGGYL